MSETTIVWNKCKTCGKLQHPDHVRCLQCKGMTFEPIEASGDCVLLTYTILKAPPTEFRDKPAYALGIVQFSNGVRALGQLTTLEHLHSGMKLKPKRAKLTDNLDGQEVFGIVYDPI